MRANIRESARIWPELFRFDELENQRVEGMSMVYEDEE
jgi:hypothetical protein